MNVSLTVITEEALSKREVGLEIVVKKCDARRRY
jgi:hypothetical protein